VFLDAKVVGNYQRLAATVSDGKIKEYLRYGYGQRVLQILDTHCKITDVIENSNDKKLENYELTELNIFLNAFYVNVIGAVDNLAWALQHTLNVIDGIDENHKKKTKIGLFSPDFNSNLKSKIDPELASNLDTYKDWFENLKKFRHPAAHRIPLYCVSRVIDKKYLEEYLKAEEQFLKQDYLKNREDYKRAQRDLNQVGTYQPIFVSYSDNFEKKIYPLSRTVEQDYEPFWLLSHLVFQCLENGISRMHQCHLP
tara:strand:- start:93 stop:854 length:762 start_codon:yes stop_codon:yes gene_type:complete